MADHATKRRLAARARWRRWSLPLLVGAAELVATAILGYHPVAALLNLVQNLLLATANKSDTSLVADYPILRGVLDWIAAPVVWSAMTLGFVSLPPARHLIDRIFPDPPGFVFSDLDERRHRGMTLIERSVTDFIGRRAELDSLRTLLGRKASLDSFQWRIVLGISGIGKTRLAIEWLASAQAEGWDIGIVDPDDEMQLTDWRPRRPTALVIDEARSRWDKRLATAMLALSENASKRRPVRILLLDQVMPYLTLADATEQHRLDESQIAPALMVGRMPEDEIRILATHPRSTAVTIDHIVQESAGRPRAAIILTNTPDAGSYAEALNRWANLMVPELTDDSATPALGLSVPLILAALVGPVSADQVRKLLADFDPAPLLRFFEGTSRESIELEIPELVPDDLAHELALRLLSKLDSALRRAIISDIVKHFPGRMEGSLAAIWRNRPDLERLCVSSKMLHSLQTAYDELHPNRILEYIEQVDTLVYRVAEAKTPLELDSALEILIAATRARPFDPVFRHREAMGEVNAMSFFGRTKHWKDLEQCGERLVALARDERFADNRSIRADEAVGAFNAMNSYAEARRWEDLERWGKRVIVLAADERFSGDSSIRLQQAMCSVNAINSYGQARRWNDLERWSKQLIALADDERFAGDRAIRRLEGMGGVAATNFYGKAGRWNDLERWGKRLIKLSEDERFADDAVVRLQETEGTVNAISAYGLARRWHDLEQWGNRLIPLADDERFSGDPAIRLREAMGVVNATIAFGGAQRWNDLEQWNQRMTVLAEDERFAGDVAIRLREAMCLVNAMTAYGSSQRWDDLERWGKRLIELIGDKHLAGDLDIRLEEAQGAANAIIFYGQARRWEDLERWGARLTALAGDARFSDNPELRLVEATGTSFAIELYRQGGLQGSGREFAWQRRLAFTAQEFPSDPKIQGLAKAYNLTWSDQQRRNFIPYGRPDQLTGQSKRSSRDA